MNTPFPIAVVEALRKRIRCLDGRARHWQALPSGTKAIDKHRLEGGLALGALHEVAGGRNGTIDGAASLFAAGTARTRARVLRRVTRRDQFTPALASAGLALDPVIAESAQIPGSPRRRGEVRGRGQKRQPFPQGGEDFLAFGRVRAARTHPVPRLRKRRNW